MGDNTKAPSQLDMDDNERANRTGGSDRRQRYLGLQTEREVQEITDLRKWDCGITIGEVLGQHLFAISTWTNGLIEIFMQQYLFTL